MPFEIFSVNSKPFGYTYEFWSVRWWQWLLSIPKSISPAFDPTGVHANINQNDPNVFFLCQTYEEGTPSIPNRTITIPAGRSIFIPIINWISILHIDGETDQELIEIAKNRMDVVGNLKFAVNGLTVDMGLDRYRVQSGLFEVALSKDNILLLPPGTVRAVSDG
ncbi:MAG: hypothetical protein ACRD8Z_15830, partial [Nitrososphaeraceae archaeon]